MLMEITRIGNLIINENGFNLLLVFLRRRNDALCGLPGGERHAEWS